MTDNCYGCQGNCLPSTKDFSNNCPCTTCIVKMMCNERVCPQWADWYCKSHDTMRIALENKMKGE